MNTLEVTERQLQKSRDEIIHLVSAFNVDHGIRIAYCGFDCSGRTFKEPGSANCVVCIKMSKDRQEDLDEWLKKHSK